LKRLLPKAMRRRMELESFKETHINRALSAVKGETTYVEIGVRDAACITQIRALRRCAIDPAPVDPEGARWKGVELFRVTSDDFFQNNAIDELGRRPVHVALADGLHEFRQTLRDILNLERFMSPSGVVFVHDCNPPTRRHAEDLNGPWNGDVWKIAPYLRTYRPDLGFFTLDCDWGVGVVTGFSRHPPTPRSEDVEKVAALDYDFLANDRRAILRLRSRLYSAPFFAMRRITS
jgi:methyltransferase family protein